MGIPGLLAHIGQGERVALTKLATEHLERTQRPLRIAIDAAIWNFQNQAAQGGKNPALRTLFFKLLNLLALPIHPVFVYDGKKKPLTKRGKTVTRYGSCLENESAKQLLSLFRFPHHTAPGEAEAECAFLQRRGVVDAVMSQDVDAMMFGSTLTLRNWSKEGVKGNKKPTHVDVHDVASIARSGIDSNGMILVALLSGGDYDENGLPGVGATLACKIAKAGFGSDLMEAVKSNDQPRLQEWRDRLEYELHTDESGYFGRRYAKLKVPNDFPNMEILGYYIKPAISQEDELPRMETKWAQEWRNAIDVPTLRQYTVSTFDWNWKSGARSFVRRLAQPLFQDRLQRGVADTQKFSLDNVNDERKDFISGGIVELRISVVPNEVVDLDFKAEEDNPEYADTDSHEEIEQDEDLGVVGNIIETQKKKKMPWSPYVAEKWWVPQILLQSGLPTIVEGWQQRQRDLLANPRLFATRKCPKTKQISESTKVVDSGMKFGSLRTFLVTESEHPLPNAIVMRVPTTPKKTKARVQNEVASPPISDFFKSQKSLVPNQSLNVFSSRLPESSTACHPSSKQSIQETKNNSGRATKCHSQTLGQEFAGVDISENVVLESTVNTKTTIVIDSSPMKPTHMDTMQLQDDDRHYEHITRRRKRQPRPPTDSVCEEGGKGQAAPHPRIETFFAKTGRREPDDISRMASVKVKIGKSTKQTSAMSRDSLPGSWQEIESQSTIGRSTFRATHIDLTND